MSRVTPAKLLRIIGYAICILIGAALWPRLIEWGFKLENTNFALSVLLNWFCLPVSMVAVGLVSWATMHMASAIDPHSTVSTVRKHTERAALFGVLATLGSCGAIASGYEPPAPVDRFYDLDLGSKFR